MSGKFSRLKIFTRIHHKNSAELTTMGKYIMQKKKFKVKAVEQEYEACAGTSNEFFVRYENMFGLRSITCLKMSNINFWPGILHLGKFILFLT